MADEPTNRRRNLLRGARSRLAVLLGRASRRLRERRGTVGPSAPGAKPYSAAVPFHEFESLEDYLASSLWKTRAERATAERALSLAHAEQSVLPGMCTCCGAQSDFTFQLPAAGADGEFPMPNWREELSCARCGLIMRWRFCFTYLKQLLPRDRYARIYITDNASPTFVWLRPRYPNLVGSEFIRDDAARARLEEYLVHLGGITPSTIRHEDVTDLGFESGSLDAVVSFDVLEHVPDYPAALREFSRVLRPGGSLLFTVPFVEDAAATTVRARLLPSREVEHLMEPEYHGDPTSADGCLCFYHFGWDLLDTIREAGFSKVRLVHGWAPAFGFMSFVGTIVATK